MQRYKTIKALGDGTYGSVFKAVNRATGDIVAIKASCGQQPPPTPHAPGATSIQPNERRRKQHASLDALKRTARAPRRK